MQISSKLLYLARECVDFAASLTPRHKEPKRKKQILIIRLDNIGDFILWLGSFQAYKELFPPEDYDITVMGNAAWENLGKNNLPAVNLFFIEPSRFCADIIYRWKILKQLRRSHYDIVVQTRFSRRYALEDAIVRLSGAEKRIGFASHSGSMRQWEEKRSKRWYTHLIPTSQADIHELERNAEFIRGLGLADFNISKPQLRISDEDANQARLIIKELSNDYYILFIGSADIRKKWQIENFAQMSKRLYETTGMTGIVCGGHEDSANAAKIINETDAPIRNLTGQTKLSVLAALIQHAKIAISNDTMAIHMSAALSVPCVCILGGGHFGRFLPYPAGLGTKIQLPVAVYKEMNCFGCNWQCVYHNQNNESSQCPYPCIFNVSAEHVWKSIDGLLHGNI